MQVLSGIPPVKPRIFRVRVVISVASDAVEWMLIRRSYDEILLVDGVTNLSRQGEQSGKVFLKVGDLRHHVVWGGSRHD